MPGFLQTSTHDLLPLLVSQSVLKYGSDGSEYDHGPSLESFQPVIKPGGGLGDPNTEGTLG